MTNDFEQGDCCPIENGNEEKALSFGSRAIRPGSIDSFADKETARQRARQLGCIGIRQYNSTTGGYLWMPCTNESDYRRVTGASPLGRRNQDRDFAQRVRRVINKKELEEKALGPNVGQPIGVAPRNMDPNTAVDADKDRRVLEGVEEINFGRGIPDPTPGGNQVETAADTATTNLEDIVKPQPRIAPPLPDVSIDKTPRPRASSTERPRTPKETNRLRPTPDAEEEKPSGPVGAISRFHKSKEERTYGSYISDVPKEFALPEEAELRKKVLDILFDEEARNSRNYERIINRTTDKVNESGIAKLKTLLSNEGLAKQLFDDDDVIEEAKQWWDEEFDILSSLFMSKLQAGDLDERDFDAALTEYQLEASIAIDEGVNTNVMAGLTFDGRLDKFGWLVAEDIAKEMSSEHSLASFGSRVAIEIMQNATPIDDGSPAKRMFGEMNNDPKFTKLGMIAPLIIEPVASEKVFRNLMRLATKSRELSDSFENNPFEKSLLGSVFSSFAMSMFMRGGTPSFDEANIETYIPNFAYDKDSAAIMFKFAEFLDSLDVRLVDYKESLRRARSEVFNSNKDLAYEKQRERINQDTELDLPVDNSSFVRRTDSRNNVKIASRLAVLSGLTDDEIMNLAKNIERIGLFRKQNQSNSFLEDIQPLSLDGAFKTAKRITDLSNGKINLSELAGALYTPNFFDGWMSRDGVSQTWESYLRFGKNSRTHAALKKMTPEDRSRFLGVDADIADMLINRAQKDFMLWTDDSEAFSGDLVTTLEDLKLIPKDDSLIDDPLPHPNFPLQWGNSIAKSVSHPVEQFIHALNLRDMQLKEIWENSHTNSKKRAIDGLLGENLEGARSTAFKIASYLLPGTLLSEVTDNENDNVPATVVSLKRQLNRYDQSGRSFIDYAIMADIQENKDKNNVLERNENLINALGIISTAIRTLSAYGDEINTINGNIKDINNSIASEMYEENGESFAELVENYMDAAPFAWGPSGAMARRSGPDYPREKRQSGAWSPLANYAQSSMYLDYKNRKTRNKLDISNSIDANQSEIFNEISELMHTLRERVSNNSLRLLDYAKSYDQKTGNLVLDFYNPRKPTSALGDSPGLIKSITMLLAIAASNARNSNERSEARKILNELLDWAEVYLPQYSKIRPKNDRSLSEMLLNGPVGNIGVKAAYDALENKKYKTLQQRLQAFDNRSKDIIFESVADRNPSSKLKELETELDEIISEGWMNERVLSSLFESISGHMDDVFEEGISERTRKRMRPVFDGFADAMKSKYSKKYSEAFGMINLESIQRKRRRANARTRQEALDSSPVGRMGAGYSPQRLQLAENNKDSHLTEEFKKRWVDIDESNIAANEILNSKNPSLTMFDGNNLAFYWKDENSRLKYLQTANRRKLEKNYIGLPSIFGIPSGFQKVKELDDSGLLEKIGLYPTKLEKHPFFVTFHGDKLVKFASTPSDINADANSMKQILGAIHPELNPETFEAVYQSWIRNPYMTIKSSSGNEVGVRFGLDNDDTKMRNELRKRVRDIYDFVSRSTGGKVPKSQYPLETESGKTAEIEFPATMRGLANDFFRRIQPSIANRGHSLESLANVFNQNAEELALPDTVNREQIGKFLRENFPEVVKNLKPEASKLDGITDDEVSEAVEIVSMLNDGTRVLKFGEIKELLSTKENGYEIWSNDAVDEVINTVNNYTAESGGSQFIETSAVGNMSSNTGRPSENLRDEFEAARMLRSMQRAQNMTPEEENAFRKAQWARQQLENIVEEDWVRFGPFPLTNAYRPIAERQSGNLSFHVKSLGDRAVMEMFEEISSNFPNASNEESVANFESKIRAALSKAARGDEILPKYPESWPPEMLDSDLNEILSPKEMAAVAKVEDRLDRETLVSMLGGEIGDKDETRQEILRIVESLPKVTVPAKNSSREKIRTPEQMSQDILIEAFDGTPASTRELVDSMSDEQLDALRKALNVSDYTKNSFDNQNLQMQRASLIRQTSVAMAKLSQTEEGRNKIRNILNDVDDNLVDAKTELLKKIQNSEIEEEDAYESLSRYVGDSESTQEISRLWFNTAAPLFSANNETSNLLKASENDKKNRVNRLFAEIALSEESPEKIKTQLQDFVESNPVDGIGAREVYIAATLAGVTPSALERKQLELISKYDGTSESAKEIIDSLTDEQVRKLWAKYIFPSLYRISGTGPGSAIRKRNQQAAAEKTQQSLNRLAEKFDKSIYGLGGFVDSEGYSADDVNMLISDAISESFGNTPLEGMTPEERKEYVSLVDYFLSGGRSLLGKGEYSEALRKMNLEKTPKAIKRRRIQRIDDEINDIVFNAGDKMEDAVKDLLDQYRNMSPEEIEARRLEEEEFDAEQRRRRQAKYGVGDGDDYEPAPDDWEDDDESTSAVGSMAKAPDTLNEKAKALLAAALTPHKKHDEDARLEFNRLEGTVYDELALQGVDIPLGFSYEEAEDVFIDPETEKIYVEALNWFVNENFDDSEFRRLKNGTLLYVPERLIGGESSDTEQTVTTEDEYAPYNPEMDEDESLRPSNFNPDRHPIASALNSRYDSFIGGSDNYFTRDWFHENGRYGTEAEKLLQSLNDEPGLIDMDKVLIYVQHQRNWLEGEDLEESIKAAASISVPAVPSRYSSNSSGSVYGMSSFSSQRRISASEKIELDRQKKIARSKAKSSKALRDGWLNDMTTGSLLDEAEIGLRDGYYPDAVLAGIKTALRENNQIGNFDSLVRAARKAAKSRAQSESRVKAIAKVLEITQNSGGLISEIYNIDNAINELDDVKDRTSRQYQERIRSQILSRVSATASIIKARDMFIVEQKEKLRAGTLSPREYLMSIQQWDSEYGPQILQMQAEIQSFSTKAEASSRAFDDIDEQRRELAARARELKELVADSSEYINVVMAQRAVNEAMKNLANNNGDGITGSGPVGNMKKIGYLFGDTGSINGFDEYLDDTQNYYTKFNIPMTKKEKALSNVMLSQLRSVNGIQTVDLVDNRDRSARQRIESYRESLQNSPVGAVRTLSSELPDMPNTLRGVLQNEYNRSVGQMLAAEKENDIRSLINSSYSTEGMPSRTTQILEEIDNGADVYALARKNNIPVTEIFSIAAIRESLLASVKYDVQKLTMSQVADKYGFDKTRLANAVSAFKNADKFRKTYSNMQQRFNELIPNNTLASTYKILNEEFPDITNTRGMGSSSKLITFDDDRIGSVKDKIAKAMRLFSDYPNITPRVVAGLTGLHQDSAKSIYTALLNDGDMPQRPRRTEPQIYSPMPNDWDYMTYGERQDWLNSDEAKQRMGEQARNFALRQNAEDIESSGSMDGPYGAMAAALKKANLDKNIYGTSSSDENGVSPIFSWRGIKDSDLIRTGFLSTSKFVEAIPTSQNISDENFAVFLNTSPAIARKLRGGKFNLSVNAARKLAHSIGKNPENIWPTYTASEQEVGPDGDLLWIAGNWSEMKPVFESIESGQNDSEISSALGRAINPKMATARKLSTNGKLEEFYKQVGKKNPNIDDASKFMSSIMPESRRDVVASFARAGYNESEIVETTGFNPNTVRNLLHELRKSGVAPSSVGSQEWISKNRKAILDDIASGMSKRQAMRKYGIGAAALNSVIQPTDENERPKQFFRDAYEAMASGPTGAMANRRIPSDVSQANGPTPEWDSDKPEVRVFLPETPPVEVGNPFYGPIEARKFSDGELKDQEALVRWFSGLNDLLKYHVFGGQLSEAAGGPDEDAPSMFPELENDKTKSVAEMIREGQFPGLIRSMRAIMGESYNQMLIEQEITEAFGRDRYSEGEDDAIEYESGFIDADSITSLNSPIAQDIMMIYRALGRTTSGFVAGDSEWINDAVRLMSRDAELERIGLNEDSRNRIKEWMRTATTREFKAAQAMSSVHSMMTDAVRDINRAMYPISDYMGRTVADDQVLAWYLDRIFKAIYGEVGSPFVLQDISREKGENFVKLNPEQLQRWYDSVTDLADTMGALFADAIEFVSSDSNISDDLFDMRAVAPRRAADGKFTIYGPDIVYSGFEDSRPYNKNVKWFARPGTEEEVESLYDQFETSPDVYWWQDDNGQISTDSPITVKDILAMDSQQEFSEYVKALTESIAESPDEDASAMLRQLFGLTLSDGVSLNKDELALAKAYSQLSGFLRSEVDALKENPTRVSENMTMSSYFPWVNWSNSSDAYPVMSGDIASMLTPRQTERFGKIDAITQEKLSGLDPESRATYQRYLDARQNTAALNNMRRTQSVMDEVMKPIDAVLEQMRQLRSNRIDSMRAIEILGALNGFANEIGAEEIAGAIDNLTMRVIDALKTNEENQALALIKDFASSAITEQFGEYLNFFDSTISVGDAFDKIAQFIKAEDKRTRRNSLMPRYKREVIDAAPVSTFSSRRKFKNLKTFDSWLNDNGYEDLTYEYYSSENEIPKNFFSESSELGDNRIVPPGDGPVGKMALNRYTKPNILSVVHAHEEAKLGKSSEVTIPHLLLGLARENIGKKSVNQSIAGRVLNRLGINVNDLRNAVNNATTQNLDENAEKVISLSFGARKTMINSVREALNRGENIIDTEHLIAAIAKTEDGRDDGLSDILQSLGTSKAELLAESISTLKRFSMGRFPNESGPVGKMGVARDAILQKDRELEALRAENNSSNLWFNRDRNPAIRNNTASDSEQVQELQRLMDLYVSGIADKSIPAYDFREGTSPFASDSILPTNSSFIYGEIGEEPSDIVGAIAYRSNLIEAMVDRSGKDYKDYTDLVAKAKSIFNNDKHIELFNDDSPTGRMSTFDGLIKSFEGIYGMPEMQPQDEYYETVYGPRDIASDNLRRAAYLQSNYSPLDISKNLTSGDDDDVTWSTNNWSLAKDKLTQASDAVIIRMNNNDLRSAEVLMIDRKSGPFTNAKALVGGLRDGTEDYMTTATREGLEEVGIDLESSIEAKPLGIITSPDWDPRFVKGARVGAGMFIVPWDSNVTAASDAKAASWVPLEDIARGKYPIAFGHAEWLRRAVAKMGKDYEGSNSADPFSDLRMSLAMRLNILAKAQRIRNQRIIARINKIRADKDAERFLPNDKMPHPLMPWGVDFKSDAWNPDGPVGKVAKPSRPIVDKSLAQDLDLLGYQSGYSIDELNSSDPISTSQKYRLNGNRVSDDRYNGLWVPYIDNSIARVSKPEFDSGNEQPTVYVLGGASGTGKTNARNTNFAGIPSYEDAVVVDPDDAKMVMPEARYWFEKRLPDAANLTHTESRALAASLMRKAASEGIDMTYDTSGQFNDGNRDLINWKNAGYKVVAHYFFSPDDVILERNAERFERTGRMVPDWIPPAINRTLYFQLPNLDPFFDELFVYDTTDDPMNPIMIARRAINEQLEIMDPKLFDFANFDRGR